MWFMAQSGGCDADGQAELADAPPLPRASQHRELDDHSCKQQIMQHEVTKRAVAGHNKKDVPCYTSHRSVNIEYKVYRGAEHTMYT